MVFDVPVLRFGEPYESMETLPVVDPRTGETLALVGQANSGLVRRDLLKVREARAALEALSCSELIAMCAKAGESFMTGTLGGMSAEQYVTTLSRTSGLPHVMARRNMAKINTVLSGMDGILRGLTRGLDLSVLDEGVGEQAGVPVSYAATGTALGVVLPSNSPGVNSIWLPAVALKTPVMIKPGREEPWTPLRLIHALINAGVPKQAFGFYPTDHDGADSLLTRCGRGILFGDDKTTRRYADNPAVEKHGTGRSKVILGDDTAEHWRDHLDVLVSSVLDNGGRSCINASCIITPRHGDAIAQALAERLDAVNPSDPADDDARLSAFANPAFAEYIDAAIRGGLESPGATLMTRAERYIQQDGRHYLLPTVVRCDDLDHPLGNTEFMCPYASVVEMPVSEAIERIGPSLAVTFIGGDESLQRRFIDHPDIDRLNLGSLPTSRVEWDQPHEGNLFEFLYRRRAIQRTATPV